MKKILMVVAVIATMMVVSCTPKQAGNNIGTSDSTKVDTTAVSVDSTSAAIDTTTVSSEIK